MRDYISKLGLELGPRSKPATSADLTEIMVTIMELHEDMLNDIILQPAAYGCAVGGLSLALDVSLRTAAMIFDEWRRRTIPEDPINVQVISKPEDPDGSE
jgi:hypothetical protein